MGKFLKSDEDRITRGIFTYARICVEVDLSQGLPDHITLNFNNSLWTQPLDYENIAFKCRECFQTEHLHYAYPLARKEPKGNKKQQKKPKGWQHTEPLEEEELKTEPTGKQMGQENIQEEKTQETNLGHNNMEQQQESQREVNGIKRTHSSEGSESDKEQPTNTMENQLAIIDTTPTLEVGEEWRRSRAGKHRPAGSFFLFLLFS